MIREKIKAIKQSLATAKLVVVSKHRSIEELQEVYEAGERCFAENRVQELLKKAPLLPSDVEWHLIGHLQTNKVKQILPLVSLIHSVDRVSLLDAIEKEASKLDRTISVLLQVHLAQEESKFGFNPGELVTLI
ncbi:MAG: pyridoxal phosphate enzyme (YggS family), partial [Bacteroidia bacterium]